ncbi:ENTH domain-containing protein [Ditylenchus destructor]|uniref:ENTH domain-containing protein n=1 Tax=Ditylenchus destructor TaxID=166010 RepID=A0AAD4N1F7_9BILA|nr:ENTH domain-containing protein [Ditylenchus destructor]
MTGVSCWWACSQNIEYKTTATDIPVTVGGSFNVTNGLNTLLEFIVLLLFNDPWGPTTALMSEIADLTHNPMSFTEIMSMLWKRLNDHGKNWRHVYKSLVLLDYLIKCGSEKVAQQCRENIYSIETLKDFQHIEDNRDQGLNLMPSGLITSWVVQPRQFSCRPFFLAVSFRLTPHTHLDVAHREDSFELSHAPGSALYRLKQIRHTFIHEKGGGAEL